jgi:hypothetical protein
MQTGYVSENFMQTIFFLVKVDFRPFRKKKGRFSSRTEIQASVLRRACVCAPRSAALVRLRPK